MIDLCRYILQGGNQCGQAAIKGEYYCRHHQFVRKAVKDAAPQGDGERKPLPLVFPEDRAAVQINYFLVMQAINDGRLDHKTASLMVRILRACDANLKKGPLYGEGGDREGGDQRSAVSDQESGKEAGSSTHVSKERHGAPGTALLPHTSKSGLCGPPTEFEFWQRRAEIVLKHQDRFLEMEKEYGGAPDYGERLNALADELLAKEAAA